MTENEIVGVGFWRTVEIGGSFEEELVKRSRLALGRSER